MAPRKTTTPSSIRIIRFAISSSVPPECRVPDGECSRSRPVPRGEDRNGEIRGRLPTETTPPDGNRADLRDPHSSSYDEWEVRGSTKTEAPRCRRRRQNFAAKRLAAPRRRISGRDRSRGESRAATRPPSSRAAAPARQRLGRGHGAPDREGGLSGDRDDERRHRLLARLPGRRADPARRNARGDRADLPGGLGSGHGRPRSRVRRLVGGGRRGRGAGARRRRGRPQSRGWHGPDGGAALRARPAGREDPGDPRGGAPPRRRDRRQRAHRRVPRPRRPGERPPRGDDPARRGVPRRRRRLRLRAGRDGGPALIGEIVRRLACPVNVLAAPGGPSIGELAKLGVARVSLGSGAMRAALTLVERIGEELRTKRNLLGPRRGPLARERQRADDIPRPPL